MKTGLLQTLSVVALLMLSTAWASDDPPPNGGTATPPAKMGGRACFIENRGQHDAAVKYYVRGARGTVFLSATEVVFSFLKEEKPSGTAPAADEGGKPLENERAPRPDKDEPPVFTRLVFRYAFAGGNPKVAVTGQKELGGKVNYLVGSQENWHANIPTFEEVLYKDLYPGVDLRFSLPGNNLRYTVLLGEGGNVDRVKLTYTGVDKLRVNEAGNLVVGTRFGDFMETPPDVFRATPNGEVRVGVRIKLIDEVTVGFEEVPTKP